MTTQQTIGRWILATITAGIDGHATFSTGRHCYCRRNGSICEIIGARGVLAYLPLAEARKRLVVSRYPNGKPIAVRDQAWQNWRWERRHGGTLAA